MTDKEWDRIEGTYLMQAEEEYSDDERLEEGICITCGNPCGLYDDYCEECDDNVMDQVQDGC